MNSFLSYDTLIIGAGAAGLFCAIEAGKRGRRVLVIDHANKAGKKILMSGGGRCNFTNKTVSAENYLSQNKHFAKSALSQYQPANFIDLVKKHNIAYHEKTLGQLFCDDKSKDIVNMLLSECESANVTIQLNTEIKSISKNQNNAFDVKTTKNNFQCDSLVIATGGLSIPTMGATPFGYQVAEQFGIKVWPTRAGLVPFTWRENDKAKYIDLSGVSVDCEVSSKRKAFSESMLFTHRGLSGPAMLQISSYWEQGESININFLPKQNLVDLLKSARNTNPKWHLKRFLTEYFSKKQIHIWFDETLLIKNLADLSNTQCELIAKQLQSWEVFPNGTEGYRTAEVTIGGVDTNAISSKTFECKTVKRLYFIGEVLDVTGWLGGYNFQWAWASGYAAGQVA